MDTPGSCNPCSHSIHNTGVSPSLHTARNDRGSLVRINVGTVLELVLAECKNSMREKPGSHLL